MCVCVCVCKRVCIIITITNIFVRVIIIVVVAAVAAVAGSCCYYYLKECHEELRFSRDKHFRRVLLYPIDRSTKFAACSACCLHAYLLAHFLL